MSTIFRWILYYSSIQIIHNLPNILGIRPRYALCAMCPRFLCNTINSCNMETHWFHDSIVPSNLFCMHENISIFCMPRYMTHTRYIVVLMLISEAHHSIRVRLCVCVCRYTFIDYKHIINVCSMLGWYTTHGCKINISTAHTAVFRWR